MATFAIHSSGNGGYNIIYTNGKLSYSTGIPSAMAKDIIGCINLKPTKIKSRLYPKSMKYT